MGVKPVSNIEIDQDKCTDAVNCRICIDACPGGVFVTYPVQEHFLKETAKWVVRPCFVSLCSGCRACQQTCPTGAIIVKEGGSK